MWAVRGNGHSVLATSTWGTVRYPAPALAQAILEQRKVEVRDLIKTPEGERSVLNLDATLAAQEKAAELYKWLERGALRLQKQLRANSENHQSGAVARMNAQAASVR